MEITKKWYKLIFMLFAGLFLQCSCSKPVEPEIDDSAGGGVETGNTAAYGRVIDELGASVSGISVRLFTNNYLEGNSSQEQFSITTTTNDSGGYRFDSLDRGNYNVVGRYDQDTLSFGKAFMITLSDTDSVNIGTDTLRFSSAVAGTVTVYDGRSPSGVKVYLRGTGLSYTVDNSGYFKFEGVPRGDHVLVADASSIGVTIPQLLSISVPYNTTVFQNILIPEAELFELSFSPGQMWSYKRTFIYKISPEMPQDTIITFINYEYTKDTIIDNQQYSKINETYFDVGDSIITPSLHGIKYVHINDDTVKVIQDRQGIGIPGALLRNHIEKNSTSAYEDPYDTTAFFDLYYPILFNLKPENIWYYRYPGDPNGHLPVKRVYTGNEIVTVPAGEYNCIRTEWDWSDSFLKDYVRYGVDLISDVGIIKRTFKFDSVSYDIFEYMGPDTIPFDTLYQIYPIMSQAMLDSISNVVASHWSLDKYLEWFSELYLTDTATYSGNVGSGLAYSIWGYNMDRSEEMQFLATTSERASSFNDIYYKLGFLEAVIENTVYAQGWDDCDWDWKSQGLWNVNDTINPFGVSPTADALKNTMSAYCIYDDFIHSSRN